MLTKSSANDLTDLTVPDTWLDTPPSSQGHLANALIHTRFPRFHTALSLLPARARPSSLKANFFFHGYNSSVYSDACASRLICRLTRVNRFTY
jgi:hypothetical protein